MDRRILYQYRRKITDKYLNRDDDVGFSKEFLDKFFNLDLEVFIKSGVQKNED